MPGIAQLTPVQQALHRENVVKEVVDLFKPSNPPVPPTEAQKNMCELLQEHLKYDLSVPGEKTAVEALILKAGSHHGSMQTEILTRINNKHATQPVEITNALYAALKQSPSAQPAVATPAMPAPQPTPMQTAAVPALNHQQASDALFDYLISNKEKISSLGSRWTDLRTDPNSKSNFQAVESSIAKNLGPYASLADFSTADKAAATLQRFEANQQLLPSPTQLLSEVIDPKTIQALHKNIKECVEATASTPPAS